MRLKRVALMDEDVRTVILTAPEPEWRTSLPGSSVLYGYHSIVAYERDGSVVVESPDGVKTWYPAHCVMWGELE